MATGGEYELRLFVERKPAYYVSNVVATVFLITSVSLMAFVLDPSSLSDRLSVVTAMLLTSIAFKLVVASLLPKTSTVTMLDSYILFAFFILTLQALEHAIAYYMGVNSDAPLAIAVTSVWCGLHAVFALCYKCRWFDRLLRPSWKTALAYKAHCAQADDAAYTYAPVAGDDIPATEV